MRDKDLPAMGSSRDPGNLMKWKGYVVAANRCRLPRVHSDPDLNLGFWRPGVRRQGQLTFEASGDGLGRIRKGDQQ
jgi:hypothetical protein